MKQVSTVTINGAIRKIVVENLHSLVFWICIVLTFSLRSQSLNLNFESSIPGAYSTGNAVSGWTISSQSATSCNTSTAWTAGSPEFSVISTPVTNGLQTGPVTAVSLGTSPLGGSTVIRLNNDVAGGLRTRIKQTFTVTSANTSLAYAFAGVWEDGGHLCCEQSGLKILVYDCAGNLINCPLTDISASGTACAVSAPGYTVAGNRTWTSWHTVYYDLRPYLGSCVTIEVTNSDCIYGTHFGTSYFDATATFSGIFSQAAGPAAFCPGSSQALLYAPLGYSSYQWFAPGNPSVPVSPLNGGDTPVLTATNAVAGNIYTVQLLSPTGCTFTLRDTLQYSSVFVAGIGSHSSCPLGASGSATLLAGGSGTGYNYSWLNALNTVVGTASVIDNLSPGMYSVQVNALNAATCGSAAATVTIGISPPNVYSVLVPFCGIQCVLSAPSAGSNYQWYNNTTLIPSGSGGTISGYTVTAPVNGASYWLRYTTFQGCKDSVNFNLTQVSAGTITVANVSYACVGASNASASIVINQNNYTGLNAFHVFSVPAGYSASLAPTSSNSFVPTAMAAGNYSVVANAGPCSYTAAFTVNPLIFNYSLTPASPTLCPANSTLYAGVSFSTAISVGQYSFSWTPSTNIVGGTINTANISVQITPPSPPPGTQATTIYSVTVTPTALNCPLTKTIAVTVANPIAPTIISPLPFCTNAALQTVTVNPPGGTFSTSTGGWIQPGSGLISPGTSPVGTSTFVYTSTLSGCSASATGTIHVTAFRSAALSASVINVCTPSCLNLLSFVQGSPAGTWSGPGVSSGSFCPTMPTGAYTLTYATTSLPNATMCPDAASLTVHINNPVTPTISAAGPFCTNSPTVQLIATPTTGSFIAGAYVNTSGVFTPALLSPGVYTLQYANCNILTTQSISVQAFVPSTITGSVADQCLSYGPVNLLPLTLSAGGNWSGPGVAGNLFNPTVAGSFTLTYATSSQPGNLCPSQSTLAVNVFTNPVISAYGNTLICGGQNSTLTASGANTYSWNVNVTNSLVVVAPPVTSTFVVTGISIQGCTATTRIVVMVANCLAIEDLPATDRSLKIHPNPFSDLLKIEALQPCRLSLFNETGALLFEQQLDAGLQTLDLRQFTDGVYILRISKAQKTEILKLVKIRQ